MGIVISQRTIIAVSLSASVAIHVSTFWLAYEYAHRAGYASAIRWGVPKLASTQAVGQADPQMPTPPEPMQLPTPVPMPDYLVMGAEDGIGNANEDFLSEQVQSALISVQDQAYLSRDPTGNNASPNQPSQKQKLELIKTGLPDSVVRDLRGVGSQSGIEQLAIGLPNFRKGVGGKSVDPDSTQSTPEQTVGKRDGNADRDQQAIVGQTRGAETATVEQTMGQNGSPGQERPQSDTDSDLFAETIDVEMRAGKLSARQGREVKLASPKFNLAMMGDARLIRFPITGVFQLRIDETGAVRKVTILKSTGSAVFDRSIELSLYEAWVQPRVRNGKAVADIVQIPYAIY